MPESSHVVAVVDDDDLIREALDILLSACGYGVELYASAESFLTALGTTKARCLMTDIELGGMSGIALGRKLVADGCELPVIFMTGSPDPMMPRRAQQAGCIAFLEKPFTPASLLAALDTALRPEPCA
jgi:FixJ family two-component response regulator